MLAPCSFAALFPFLFTWLFNPVSLYLKLALYRCAERLSLNQLEPCLVCVKVAAGVLDCWVRGEMLLPAVAPVGCTFDFPGLLEKMEALATCFTHWGSGRGVCFKLPRRC